MKKFVVIVILILVGVAALWSAYATWNNDAMAQRLRFVPVDATLAEKLSPPLLRELVVEQNNGIQSLTTFAHKISGSNMLIVGVLLVLVTILSILVVRLAFFANTAAGLGVKN